SAAARARRGHGLRLDRGEHRVRLKPRIALSVTRSPRTHDHPGGAVTRDQAYDRRLLRRLFRDAGDVGRLPIVGDLGHELVGPARPGHRGPETGEEIHERLHRASGATTHDDLGLAIVDRPDYRSS